MWASKNSSLKTIVSSLKSQTLIIIISSDIQEETDTNLTEQLVLVFFLVGGVIFNSLQNKQLLPIHTHICEQMCVHAQWNPLFILYVYWFLSNNPWIRCHVYSHRCWHFSCLRFSVQYIWRLTFQKSPEYYPKFLISEF